MSNNFQQPKIRLKHTLALAGRSPLVIWGSETRFVTPTLQWCQTFWLKWNLGGRIHKGRKNFKFEIWNFTSYFREQKLFRLFWAISVLIFSLLNKKFWSSAEAPPFLKSAISRYLAREHNPFTRDIERPFRGREYCTLYDPVNTVLNSNPSSTIIRENNHQSSKHQSLALLRIINPSSKTELKWRSWHTSRQLAIVSRN